jgi:hypothetical protein
LTSSVPCGLRCASDALPYRARRVRGSRRVGRPQRLARGHAHVGACAGVRGAICRRRSRPASEPRDVRRQAARVKADLCVSPDAGAACILQEPRTLRSATSRASSLADTGGHPAPGAGRSGSGIGGRGDHGRDAQGLHLQQGGHTRGLDRGKARPFWDGRSSRSMRRQPGCNRQNAPSSCSSTPSCDCSARGGGLSPSGHV